MYYVDCLDFSEIYLDYEVYRSIPFEVFVICQINVYGLVNESSA